MNIEIKARCRDGDKIRRILAENGARFVGTDHQIDTYFRVPRGRLKLRQGNIENALIFYNRPDEAGPKKADVTLCRFEGDTSLRLPALREALTASLGVLATVKKKREIHFIDNVKFHIDEVDQLGCFVEIETIDTTGQIGEQTLRQQCQTCIELLKIDPTDLIDNSYSDIIPAK